ncbi:ClpXP protease specificity-enhancing factor [Zoogloea sp.]|uniref:ClpXP protease specificity-enhancing factor n=1 Tax=Zoogloea sp. TaxID=49181 RepID=UPI0026280F81|nr:ClpXP protease specificity-enhancing factor [Zoogloea sp.]MDD3353169.1 ClpXP protease specificity-enhancing factor [Zoogloea sp.]
MTDISTKPYLIRAIFEWCVDQGLTPYLAVSVDNRTSVPRNFVQDGQIVLNVSPDATQSLVMGNELIAFQARFSGAAQNISIPVENVAAIYARENGHGMAFEVPDLSAQAEMPAPMDEVLTEAVEEDAPEPPKGGGRARLKVVK